MKNDNLTYDELYELVKKLEVENHNLKEQNESLNWFKHEYKQVEKLKVKLTILQNVVKELVRATDI